MAEQLQQAQSTLKPILKQSTKTVNMDNEKVKAQHINASAKDRRQTVIDINQNIKQALKNRPTIKIADSEDDESSDSSSNWSSLSVTVYTRLNK